jgi:hypothetical protein
MFPKLHAIVKHGLLERDPWDLRMVPAKMSRKGNWHHMNLIPFKGFSMGIIAKALVSPFFELKNHCSVFDLYCMTMSTLYQPRSSVNISDQEERIPFQNGYIV